MLNFGGALRRRGLLIFLTIFVAVIFNPYYGFAQQTVISQERRDVPPVDIDVAYLITAPQTRTPTGVAERRIPLNEWPRLMPLSELAVKRLVEAAKRATVAQTGEAEVGESGFGTLSHTVAVSFAGLNAPQATPLGFEPFHVPDTIVATSGSRVLEGVNSALGLFSTGGAPMGTMLLNDFFSVPVDPVDPQSILIDPKVYFDRNATNQRFYVVAVKPQRTMLGESKLYLAVSRSAEPSLLASDWCRYTMDAVRDAGTPLESWADYPSIGAGQDAFIISTNQYQFDTIPPFGFPFTYAIVRVFDKIALANNASSCPPLSLVVTFQPAVTAGDAQVWTLQPTQHYTNPSSFSGTTNPVYLVNTYTGPNHRYRIWRIKNVASSPTIDGPVDVSGTFTYNMTPNPAEIGNPSMVNDDARVKQVAGIGDALYPTHSTVCNFEGGNAEACVRIMRIIVSQTQQGNLKGTRDQQHTTGGGAGVYRYMGGVAANVNNHTMLVFQQSTSTTFTGIWRTGKNLSAKNYEVAANTVTGTCTNPHGIVGDYVGAQTDPDGLSFWLAGQRHILISNVCQWSTQITKVLPP